MTTPADNGRDFDLYAFHGRTRSRVTHPKPLNAGSTASVCTGASGTRPAASTDRSARAESAPLAHGNAAPASPGPDGTGDRSHLRSAATLRANAPAASGPTTASTATVPDLSVFDRAQIRRAWDRRRRAPAPSATLLNELRASCATNDPRRSRAARSILIRPLRGLLSWLGWGRHGTPRPPEGDAGDSQGPPARVARRMCGSGLRTRG